ncbi:MAG: rhamnan synthesis F family protein [Bacteroidota bacterium]
MNNNDDISYSIHDFDKVWRIIPFNRHQKEILKNILFSFFSFLLNKWDIYHNWKHAKPFKNKWYSFVNSNLNNKPIDNIRGINSSIKKNDKKIAFVIHVFYVEIFKEILKMIKNSEGIEIKLFITCPYNLKFEIEKEIQHTQFPYLIIEVENRGRDVLPFIRILPIIFSEDFNFVMKLHTKKSGHLKRNHNWRNDLYEKLLNPDNIQNFLEICNSNPEIGMIGPAGHILPMSLYYGGNSEKVMNILRRMEISDQKLSGSIFIAGTMFFASKKALLPILNIGLKEEEFEVESMQVDGTLAHALERVLGIIVNQYSLRIIDSDSKPYKINCKITRNYKFTL